MAIGMIIGAMLQPGCSDSAASRYPASRQLAQVDHYHGVAVADPYRWLEDDNSPETRQWVRAQQQFAEQQLMAIPGTSGFGLEIALDDIWFDVNADGNRSPGCRQRQRYALPHALPCAGHQRYLACKIGHKTLLCVIPLAGFVRQAIKYYASC